MKLASYELWPASGSFVNLPVTTANGMLDLPNAARACQAAAPLLHLLNGIAYRLGPRL